MNLQKILQENSIAHKMKSYSNNEKIYKIGEKTPTNVVTIDSTNNIFTIDRELFYYLQNQKETYSFMLINKQDMQIYFLEFKEKINWIAASFERSDKEIIYFGKIVLQHKVDKNDIINKICKY